jgi:hypothetical protein
MFARALRTRRRSDLAIRCSLRGCAASLRAAAVSPLGVTASGLVATAAAGLSPLVAASSLLLFAGFSAAGVSLLIAALRSLRGAACLRVLVAGCSVIAASGAAAGFCAGGSASVPGLLFAPPSLGGAGGGLIKANGRGRGSGIASVAPIVGGEPGAVGGAVAGLARPVVWRGRSSAATVLSVVGLAGALAADSVAASRRLLAPTAAGGLLAPTARGGRCGSCAAGCVDVGAGGCADVAVVATLSALSALPPFVWLMGRSGRAMIRAVANAPAPNAPASRSILLPRCSRRRGRE